MEKELEQEPLLLVDDEPNLRRVLSKLLEVEGFRVATVGNAQEAERKLAEQYFRVVITDVRMPGRSGLELLRAQKSHLPQTEFIVLTAYGNVQDGVQAMKDGAYDYLVKGDNDEELPLVARRACEKALLKEQVQELQTRLDSKSGFDHIVGSSARLKEATRMAAKVAATDARVLLVGETGTGKELFAEAIHRSSRRSKKPFRAINCAAIPKELQESELFGHVKGAFTGAQFQKAGLFEAAHRGTLFLDEVGEMSLDLQSKLLRTLENLTIRKIGGQEEIPVDVRIVAATNRDLYQDTHSGQFRSDLFYRLNTFAIELPPLRERPDDIPLLARYFIQEFNQKMGVAIQGVTAAYEAALLEHDWPGNIRELRNTIERSMVLAEGEWLTPDTLPPQFDQKPAADHRDAPGEADLSMDRLEENHIRKVLQITQQNKKEAARRMNMGLTTLYRKLKQYNLE